MATTETTTSASKNGGAVTAGAAAQELPVHAIPLSKVYFDAAWNARHPKFTSGTGDAGEDRGTLNGIVSLAESMKAGRQDTPAKVRPIPPGYKGKLPQGVEYLGVFGFRRNAALHMLAEGAQVPDGKGGTVEFKPSKMLKDPTWDPKNPTILATIESLDDADALAANIAENTARDDLRAPDLAFQIYNYLHSVPADDKKRRSVSHMADRFGKVDRYVRRLINITTALLDGKTDSEGKRLSPPEPRVFNHWRESPVHVPIKEMDTLVKNPGPYQAQYDNLVNGQRQLTSGGSPVDPNADPNATPENETTWIDRAIEKAEAIGGAIGALQARCEIRATEQEDDDMQLDVAPIQWDKDDLVALATYGGPKIKKSANGTEVNRIIAAAKRGVRSGHEATLKAHEKALAAAEEEEEEEEEEDAAQTEKAGSKGGKGKN